MNRRWIHSIPMSPAWNGAYATRWAGFERAWIRSTCGDIRKLRKWNPRRVNENSFSFRSIKEIPDVCGVYVFLSRDNYVLYVGMSRRLGSEIRLRYKRFKNFQKRYIHLVAAHQALQTRLAKKMEEDLLWYYTPPWNTRFKSV